MRKFLFNLVLVASVLCLTKCGVYSDIYSEYDRSTDFSKYKTFAWLPDSGMTIRADTFRNSAYDNDVIRNNAKNYINHQLVERGMRINPDDPDALFQLVLLNEKKQRIITDFPAYYPGPYYYGTFRHYPYYFDGRTYYPYYYPYYDYYTFYGWGCANMYCNPNIYTYKQTYVKGTIIINMFDQKNKKLIWTVSAEGNIYDPSTVKEEVDPAIRKMMKKFPVKPDSKSDKSDLYVNR